MIEYHKELKMSAPLNIICNTSIIDKLLSVDAAEEYRGYKELKIKCQIGNYHYDNYHYDNYHYGNAIRQFGDTTMKLSYLVQSETFKSSNRAITSSEFHK